jgi:AraC-like DNA-binding protein
MKAGDKEYLLSPGDFLLIMPGTPHSVIFNPAKEKKYFVMAFELPHLEENDEQNRPLVTKIKKLSCTLLVARGFCCLSETTEILDKMEKELIERKTGWLFMFRGYCLEFLIHCLREVIEPANETPKETDNLNLAIEIINYMRSYYNQKITLKDISDILHVSSRHAQRIFKDFFGVSYARTLNLYRMNYAKNYLINTDLSIDEIAELVGMSSAQTLYKLFREQEKMSINEYRVMQKELSKGLSSNKLTN